MSASNFLIIVALFISIAAAERAEPWIKRTALRGDYEDNVVDVTFGLTQRNLDVLEGLFWNISNPSHESYAKYWTFSEIVDLVAPSETSVRSVMTWLNNSGVAEHHIVHHKSKDFVTAKMPIKLVNKMLKTVHTPIVHPRAGHTGLLMDKSYVIPDEVKTHIDSVSHYYATDLPVEEVHEVEHSKRGANVEDTPVFLAFANARDIVRSIVVFFCPDGSAPVLDHCGDLKIKHYEVTIYHNGTNDKISSSTDALKCAPCTEAILYCSFYQKFYDWAVTPIQCVFKSFAPKNVLIQAEAKMIFADGSTSNIGKSNVISAADVASPPLIDELYNIDSNIVVNQHNKQSVVEFLRQYVDKADLKKYFKKNGLPDRSSDLQFFNPADNHQKTPGFEANLDVQVMMGIARNVKTYVYSYPHGTFLKWMSDLVNQDQPPFVASVSYFDVENMYTTPLPVEQRLNIEFMKAGVRGISILVASGDVGVFNPYDQSDLTHYVPIYPSSSPYVTTVGGTSQTTLYNTDQTCIDKTCPEEVVCSIQHGAFITSGGGFSNSFNRPSYQDSAVTSFLARISDTSAFNSTGRAYPDVSALAHNFLNFVGGKYYEIDGTSASAPLFAAMVTLLNDIRLQQGYQPLGFLNPFLYGLPASAFNDITKGNNMCNEYLCSENIGFTAGVGWDPVTGLGSPNFQELAAAVRALPGVPFNSSA